MIILQLLPESVLPFLSYKRPCSFIPSGKEGLYSSYQLGNTLEALSADGLISEYAKPDLEHIHPGGSSGSEMSVTRKNYVELSLTRILISQWYTPHLFSIVKNLVSYD
jgi:hypothetical protein